MIEVLYIAGAGRSGSTLFERVLGQLNGAVAIGEFRHVWHRDPAVVLCGCGRTIAECPFWGITFRQAGIEPDTGSFKAMAEAQRAVDRIRYAPMMVAGSKAGQDFQQRHANYATQMRRLFTAILQESKSRIIVDSSKDLSTLFLLTGMADVKVRILHIVRDSRAVAYAWTKRRTLVDVIGQTREQYRYPPHRSAFDWLYRNGLTELLRGRADGYMRLRYKEIVADPHGATAEVAGFMGLGDSDLSFIQANEIRFPVESHALGGNPMRHEEAVVRVRMDDAWQREFPMTGKVLVTAMTWPLLKRYKFL